ncbi:cyanophycinase [Microbacterium hominis]|uniref:Cyanophycinase n=1 Tax=Microbacterium hominis TaxID=162426 RepID=A0A7D4UID9_9MICO|nr:cyanophycinase [Microbacterium hominis]QKJ18347.1 cyanophycinase [Microbacterium hominis]
MSRPAIGLGVLAATTALVLSATAASAAPPAHSATSKNPHAVLIGGNLRENAEILQRIVDLADPDGKGPLPARIAIVTAAASPARTAAEAADPDRNNAAANGLYYSALFERFGAETYAVPIDTGVQFAGDAYTPAGAFDPAVSAEIASATGVFFGGGDQMRYVRTLFQCEDAALEAFTECGDTPAMTAIREVAARGVVAGVSAGLTIQQGADMITGGESYQAWRDGATAGYLDDATALGYLPHGGFGFVDEVLLDSHFTTWGRQGRAVELALETGHPYVLGVDETTAVVLDRVRGVGHVIGEHGASVLDVTGATVTEAGTTGVRWSYAVAGDTIDLRHGAAVRAGTGAKKLAAEGADPAIREDAWDSLDGAGGTSSLRDLAREVVASHAGVGIGLTYEEGPRFATHLTRDGATRAWASPSGSTGFSQLRVDIVRAD